MYTISQLQDFINRIIADIPMVHPPIELYQPIKYVMQAGGKRVRPVLVFAAYQLYKDNLQDVIAPAIGIELFHNYTLLHDDLMDRADMRRGRKTVHVVWDDNTAILSGDAMYVMACKYIAQTAPSKYLKEVSMLFYTTALEVCEGQQFDVNFEKRHDVTAEAYIEMIRLKTAVLLAASLKIGAIMGDADEQDARLLYDFGINLGLAFQLKDDYLDVFGDPNVFGKNIGGDIVCNKKTYLLIKAIEEANDLQKQELIALMENYDLPTCQKISAVTQLYNQIGVKTMCKQKMEEYYNHSLSLLAQVSVPQDKKRELQQFAYQLMHREI